LQVVGGFLEAYEGAVEQGVVGHKISLYGRDVGMAHKIAANVCHA
jgi:hypothetical protein